MDDLLFSLFRLLDDWSPFFGHVPDDVLQCSDRDDKRAAIEQRSRQDSPEEIMQGYFSSRGSKTQKSVVSVAGEVVESTH